MKAENPKPIFFMENFSSDADIVTLELEVGGDWDWE